MPGAVRTRVATPSDAILVTDILNDSYPTAMTGYCPPELLVPALERMCRAHPRLLEGRTYFLAERDGTALGCGGWSAARPGGSGREPGLAHIRHFAVRTACMGQGVGRALFQRCAVEARALGFARMETQSSLNAEGFYAALGFRGIEQIDVDLGNGVTLRGIRMERTL